jgi:hypothetical protein
MRVIATENSKDKVYCPIDMIFVSENTECEHANYGCTHCKNINSFDTISRQVMLYMLKNHHPHTTMIVTNDTCEVVEGIKCNKL